MRGHVAAITETESTYVMIESTSRFDGVVLVPSFTSLGSKVKYATKKGGTRESHGRRLHNELCSLKLCCGQSHDDCNLNSLFRARVL